MSIKSLELEPSKENLLTTLTKDLLDRNKSVWKFARLCDAQDSKCSIAIDGKWGSGKTFFVLHVQMLMNSFNNSVESLSEEEKCEIKNAFSKDIRGDKNRLLKPEVCVYYDAWSNDNDEDPILSLVYEIIKETAQYYPFKKGTDCMKTVSLIVNFFTGKNVVGLVELMRERDPLSELKSNKEIHVLVKDFLDSLLYGQGNRLIIFIDELDRCRPEYAVRLLERIKHYFSNDRITFVFSLNISELQHTVKRYYGEGFDACRYLDRFFDYRIALPPANMTGYYKEMGLDNLMYIYDYVCKSVIEYCNFELREIEKYCRMTKIAGYKATHSTKSHNFSSDKGIMFSLCIFIPIIIGLRMTDLSLYNEFIEGKNPKPLFDILGNREMIKSYCTLLLKESETYDVNPKDKKTTVVFTEKLNEAYIALFSKKEDTFFGETNIGECLFSYYTKDTVLRTASMLSSYASYD